MFKSTVAVMCLAAFVAEAQAAPVTDWKQVSKALDAIQTPLGISVLKRINRCEIVPEKQNSYIDNLTVENRDYGAKAGDTILMVKLDFPPMPITGPTAPPPRLMGQPALWVISHGQASPISQWAISLQKRTVPLAHDSWLNC
ncbi:MAG: hypothetical protein WCA81_12005 [Rhizomicrobium sp.]